MPSIIVSFFNYVKTDNIYKIPSLIENDISFIRSTYVINNHIRDFDRTISDVTKELEMAESMPDEFIRLPWKCYKLENDFYIIKYHTHRDGFKILVSDGINLWYESLTNSEIQSRHDTLNTTVESPVDQILIDVENIISHFETVSVFVERTEKRMKFICESKSDEPAPFIWHFQLSDHDKTMFADHLTFPFVSMMIEQEARINELCQIIIQKDNEIHEYKLSGATLSRARVESKKFEMSKFLTQIHSPVDLLRNSAPVELLASNDKLQTLYRMMTECVRLTNRFTTKNVVEDSSLNSDSVITHSPQKIDLNDSYDLQIKRREELKKRLIEKDKAKEANRKRAKIVKL